MKKKTIFVSLVVVATLLGTGCVTLIDFSPLGNLLTSDSIQGRWCREGNVSEALCYEFVGERIVQFSTEGFGVQHEGRYTLRSGDSEIVIDFFGSGGFEETLDYVLEKDTLFLSGDDPVAGGGGTGRFIKQ